MKRRTLFYLGLTFIVSLSSSFAFAQSIFDYNGITYKVIKDADEASTFGTAAVTAKSDGFYEGTITIPNAVKQSNDGFADAYKVVAIDDYAFKGSPTLTKVVLPMTIESIGNNAFEGCKQLKQIDIPEGLLTHIGKSSFASSGLKSIKLPEGITELPYLAFYDCRALEQVILPKSLSKIGMSVFLFCQSLKSIELPKNLMEIGQNCFNASGLTSIKLPDRIVAIPPGAFQLCFDLEEVVLSPYTATIKSHAFSGCGKLSKINKPESINEIGNFAFNYCPNISDYYLSEEEIENRNKYGFDKASMEIQIQQMRKTTWNEDSSLPEENYPENALENEANRQAYLELYQRAEQEAKTRLMPFRDEESGLYGYEDANGKTVIPAIYQDAQAFKDGYAVCLLDGKYGLVAPDGRQYLFNYREILTPSGERRYYIGRKKALTKEYVISLNPLPAETEYNDVELAFEEKGITPVQRLGRYGYIGADGTELEAPKYKRRLSFNSPGLAIAETDEGKGIVNSCLKHITELKYPFVKKVEGDAFLYGPFEKQFGVVTKLGEISIKEGSYERTDYLDGFSMILTKTKDGTYTIVDLNGKEIVPKSGSIIVSEGIAIIKNGGDPLFLNLSTLKK